MLLSSKKITSVELFGGNLEAIRKKENVSIKDFAKRISYDRSSYGYLELGVHDMRLTTVVRIAETLNKDVSALFDRSFRDQVELQERTFAPYDYMKIFVDNANRFYKANSENISISLVNGLEVERETISRIVHGKVKSANIKTLDAISLMFDIPLSRFFKIN